MNKLYSAILLTVRYKSVMPKMRVVKCAPVIKCSEEISNKKAAEYLSNGQVIAIPTDTIYGLACSANCPDAIKRLYSIKGRDASKPVAICVSAIKDLRIWGESSHLSDDLLNKLLPGPLTVVLEKTNNLNNPYLNPSTTKIGIRIPDHQFVNSITEIFQMPMALTSANFSNEPSTLSVKEFEHLYSLLGAVFDGGVLCKGLDENRAGSTVVDLSIVGYYKIIRKGISHDNIVKILEAHGLCSVKDT